MSNQRSGSSSEDRKLAHDCIALAQQLYRDGKLTELQAFANESLDVFPYEAELWRLLAVAEGTLGNPHAAKECLITIMSLDAATELDGANLCTAYFQCGEPDDALMIVKAFYDKFDDEARLVMLRSVVEALRTGLITEERVPVLVRHDLSSIRFIS